MSRVNEREATIAVDAAAKTVYEANREAAAESLRRSGVLPTAPPWDKLDSLAQNEFRTAVLPIVWAALEAIPDRSRGLWLEGYYANDAGIHEDACPYPLV